MSYEFGRHPTVHIYSLSAPLLCVCWSVRASAYVHTRTLSLFFTHVRGCGCVSPRVCNIMIVHTHEYICGFKSHCLPRRAQTAALMRRASVVRTVVLRARRQIIDLLYPTPGSLDNYLIPRIKITRQINLR